MTMRTFASKYFPESTPAINLEEATLFHKNAQPKILLKQIDIYEAKAKGAIKKFIGLKESTPDLVKALHDLHLEGKYEKNGQPYTPPQPKNFYESARAYVHNLPYRVIDSPKGSVTSSRIGSYSSAGSTDGAEKKSVRWAEQLVDVREIND